MAHKKKGGKKTLIPRERKLAWFIIEVARATSEGKAPLTQKDIRKAIQHNKGENIPPATSSEFVKTLESDAMGKVWLRTEGHSVFLAAEETTLIDSAAIEALHIAYKLKDANDHVPFEAWAQACQQQLRGATAERCREFLSEYMRCLYCTEVNNPELFLLDIRAYNEDSFYLNEAAQAKMKKRLSRRLSQKSGK
jgi:hypothetical protein